MIPKYHKLKKLMYVSTLFLSLQLIPSGIGAGSAHGFSVAVSPNYPIVSAPCDPKQLIYEVRVAGDSQKIYTLSFSNTNSTLEYSFSPARVYGNKTSILTVFTPRVVSRPYYKEHILRIRADLGSSWEMCETKLIIANFVIKSGPNIKKVRALTDDKMTVTVSPYPSNYPPIPGNTTFNYEIKEQVFLGNIFKSTYFDPPALSQTSGSVVFHFKAPYIVGRYRVKFYAQYGSHYSNLVKTPWRYIDVSDMPNVSTGSVIGLGPTGANLEGYANDMYTDNTIVWFEWGETTSYGYATTSQTLPAYKRENVAINHRIDGLLPETKYYYRIASKNEWGTVYGEDRFFTTTDIESPLPQNISISPTSFDYGLVNITEEVAQTFIISNTGDLDLEINTLSISGTRASEFNIQNDNCTGQIIAPSENCQCDIVFSPIQEGTANASLIITSDDPDQPQLVIDLSGEGNELASSIVLLFPFDDTENPAVDTSGNNNNGIVNGAEFIEGEGLLDGNSYQFDFSNRDNIEIPYNKSLSINEQITIEAWIKPYSWDNFFNRFVSKYPAYLIRGQEGRAHFQIRTENNGYQNVYDNDVMSLNQWHYVAGTFNGQSLKLYVDGILKGTTMMPEVDTIINNESAVCIGEYGMLNEGFSGMIDNIAIYKQARSQSEIEKTYAYFSNKPPSVPIVNCPEDQSMLSIPRPVLTVYNSEDPDMDALSYEFELYTSIDMAELAASAVVTEESDITSWTVPFDLSNNSDYYWRVRANDGILTGSWTDIMNFRIEIPTLTDIPAEAPDNLELIYPPDNETGLGSTITFKWGKYITDSMPLTYNFSLCRNQDFADCNPVELALSVNSRMIGFCGFGLLLIMVIGLRPPRGKRGWKESMILLVVLLIIPLCLTVCSSSEDSIPFIHDNGSNESTNEISYKVADLEPSTTYYWKVTAMDKNGVLASSDIWKFTTE